MAQVDSVVISIFSLHLPSIQQQQQTKQDEDDPSREYFKLVPEIPQNSFLYFQASLNNEILTTDPLPAAPILDFNTQLEFILTKRAFKYLKSIRSMIKLSCFAISPHAIVSNDSNDLGRLFLGYFMFDLRSFTQKEKKQTIKLHSNGFHLTVDIALSMIAADFVHSDSPLPLGGGDQTLPVQQPINRSIDDTLNTESEVEPPPIPSSPPLAPVSSSHSHHRTRQHQTRINLKSVYLERSCSKLFYTLTFDGTKYNANIMEAHPGLNHFPHSLFILESIKPIEKLECSLNMDGFETNLLIDTSGKAFFEGGHLEYDFINENLAHLEHEISKRQSPTRELDDKIGEDQKIVSLKQDEEHAKAIVNNDDLISPILSSMPIPESPGSTETLRDNNDKSFNNSHENPTDSRQSIEKNAPVTDVAASSSKIDDISNNSLMSLESIPIRETEEYKAAQFLEQWKQKKLREFKKSVDEEEEKLISKHLSDSSLSDKKFSNISISKVGELAALETRVSSLLHRLDKFRDKIKFDLDTLTEKHSSRSTEYRTLFANTQDSSRRLHDAFVQRMQYATEEYERLQRKLNDVQSTNNHLREKKTQIETSQSMDESKKYKDDIKMKIESEKIAERKLELEEEAKRSEKRVENVEMEQNKYKDLIKRALLQVLSLRKELDETKQNMDDRQTWKRGHEIAEDTK